MIKKVFAAKISLDFVFMWEDMRCKRGSLVSPSFVKRIMAPRYKRITDLLHAHGIAFIGLDSDGNTEELLPKKMKPTESLQNPAGC